MSVYELDKTLNGGARENRFKVNFTLPAGIPGEIRELSLLVTTTNVPGSTRGTITITKDGKVVRIAGDNVPNETFPCSLRVPKDAKKAYSTFYEWYNLPDTSNDYKVKMNMQQLDTQNNVIATFEMTGVWVSVLPDVTFNTDSADTISTFEVTFTLDTINLV